MKLLEGWKIALYASISFVLFVAGMLYVLFNRQSAPMQQSSSSQNIQTTKQAPQTQEKSEKTEATEQPVDASDDMTAGYGSATPQAGTEPAVAEDEQTQPEANEQQEPANDEPEEARPTQTPTVKPVPLPRCGGCGSLSLVKDVLCPLSSGTVSNSLLCKTDQTQ